MFRSGLIVLLAGCGLTGVVAAADWPMWRHDSGRTANSPEELAETLHLHWTVQAPPRVPVWDDPLNQDLMPYDRIFEPVVAGERLFVGFNDTDKLAALDIRTGEELWSFHAGGPVRLPPVAWEGKVYFVSDDGRLYCVRAESGELVWQFRGGPSEQKVIGNRRVISAWPARGGPVIRDGRVYFAASIWPFMGTFIHALDAETGSVVWVNDGTGAQFIKQPHAAPAFGGVAPQGALVATEKFLLVPGGRSVPAVFDRETGEFRYFHLDAGGKGTGGSLVLADDERFYVHTRDRGVRSFQLSDGKKEDARRRNTTLNEPVLTRDGTYSAEAHTREWVRVMEAEAALHWTQRDLNYNRFELEEAEFDHDSSRIKKAKENLEKQIKKEESALRRVASAREALTNGWHGALIQARDSDSKIRWSLPADGSGDLIKAGNHLYAAGQSNITAIRLPLEEDGEPRIVWSQPVEGTVLRLLAARGMLFAVTLEGRILAFGETNRKQKPVHRGRTQQLTRLDSPAQQQVDEVLKAVTVRGGYAFCFGLDDGEVLRALTAGSSLHLNAVEANGERVARLRREFDDAGLYGRRVTLHQGEPVHYKSPSYVADLVVVGADYSAHLENPALFQRLFESVRPYGGVMWVRHGQDRSAGRIGEWAVRAGLENARLLEGAGGTLIFRDGALPGSADWTHQYGDVANTGKSDDARVKAPLGLLWFGGNSNMDVLPRHGHGPPEQVTGGLLYVEGMNTLSARDVYTGNVLWRREFEDLGTFGIYFDDSYTNSPLNTAYNQKHIPGANGRGCNYIATTNGIYLAVSNTCQVLDSRTGESLRTVTIPPRDGEERKWGYIGVYEEVLIGGMGFAHYRRQLNEGPAALRPSIEDYSASRGLAGFDRHTGQLLWEIDARHAFLHNGIAVGNGRVYVLDRLPGSAESKLKRRGGSKPEDYRVAAFDYRTGQLLWQVETNVFGSFLNFSKEHDLLLQAGAKAADRLRDEVDKGMIAYNARDGSVKWEDHALRYTGPLILHNDILLTTFDSYKLSNGAFNLSDGTPHLVSNPLTGRMEPWRISRTYGCNTVIASENLLTFRSGAAGYYDMQSRSGTGNLGGFKSSCTANLVVANGVMNAPDYTRTCSCAYQNQTSLALVHMPEMEMWTHTPMGKESSDGEQITRVGINFGAPGDRRADDGTFWLDYPSVGGDSPTLGIEVDGSDLSYFRRHSSQVSGPDLPWVLASGVMGVESVSITPEIIKPKEKPSARPKDDDEDEEEEEEDGKPAEEAIVVTGEGEVGIDRPALLTYTVRLHFVEPEDVEPGARVFDVLLQGEPVARSLDIRRETGASLIGLVREFNGILVEKDLVVRFVPSGASGLGPVLSGIELKAEAVALGE